jgi:hypothetical protein
MNVVTSTCTTVVPPNAVCKATLSDSTQLVLPYNEFFCDGTYQAGATVGCSGRGTWSLTGSSLNVDIVDADGTTVIATCTRQ